MTFFPDWPPDWAAFIERYVPEQERYAAMINLDHRLFTIEKTGDLGRKELNEAIEKTRPGAMP